MKILCSVAAEFSVKGQAKPYNVKPTDLYAIIDAPDWIQGDPLFDLLMKDGSLQVVKTLSQQKKLENNPALGFAPDGKALTEETAEADAEKKTTRGRKPKEE